MNKLRNVHNLIVLNKHLASSSLQMVDQSLPCCEAILGWSNLDQWSTPDVFPSQINKELWRMDSSSRGYLLWKNCTGHSPNWPEISPRRLTYHHGMKWMPDVSVFSIYRKEFQKSGASSLNWRPESSLVAIQTTLLQNRAIILCKERINPDPQEREDRSQENGPDNDNCWRPVLSSDQTFEKWV